MAAIKNDPLFATIPDLGLVFETHCVIMRVYWVFAKY